MSAIDVLQHPRVAPSSAWAAVEKLLGQGARVYEPETLEVELGRRGVVWEPPLAAKILGAQTMIVTRTWTWDYDVLFAFALAGSGVPSAADAIHHPEPHDLAWAMREIEVLCGHAPDDDHGFDPDRIDPAIAAVLHHDGWVLAPEALAFAQVALDRLTGPDHAALRNKVAERWSALKAAPEADARRVYAEVPESALRAQLGHLYSCALELSARAALREEHRRGLL